MALISAFTIIRAISLFHLTAAYFFLAAPKVLSDQNVVFILGESMRIVCNNMSNYVENADQLNHRTTQDLSTSPQKLPPSSASCSHSSASQT